MSNPRPTWQRLSHKTVYKGYVHIVEHQVVLPNGEHSTYEVDHAEGFAVAVLIRTKQDEVLLAYQYRFPLDKWIYDLPAGGVPFSETPEAGIRRECQEEIGIMPKKLIKLVTIYLTPGRSDWPVHIFYCDEYEVATVDYHDSSEEVKLVKMPFAQLQAHIDKQEIVDPALLIAWYTARNKGYIKLD